MTENIEEVKENEIDLLKDRADKMGISYHPNIGVDKLKNKIDTALGNGVVEEEVVEEKGKVETEAQRFNRIRAEATRLVRIRLSCMNPAKSAWNGEMFTVSNRVIGEIKKFVPFNAGDEGWHVPFVIYKMIKARKYQTFYDVKAGRNKIKRGKLVSEFNIEILPDLTEKELTKLASEQAAKHNID